MKKERLYIWGLVLAGILTACSNPASNSPGPIPAITPVPNPGTVVPAQTASLVGTWTSESSGVGYSTSGSGIKSYFDETYTVVMTFNADGSYLEQEKEIRIPQTGGVASQSDYYQSKGTYSAADGILKVTETASKSSGVSFDDPSASWSTKTQTTTPEYPAVFLGQSLYIHDLNMVVLQSVGTHNGIVGSWSAEVYSPNDNLPYIKRVYQFNADGSWIGTQFESADRNFTSPPTETTNSRYTLDGSKITMVTDSETSTMSYVISGGYLLVGNPFVRK